MNEREKPAACYRDRDNGVRFIKAQHQIDCADPDCKGCKVCPERRHCTGKRNCSWHIPEGSLTCGRCVGDARREIGWIVTLAPLALTQAIMDGLTSPALNLAGPAANVEAWSWRKVAAKQGKTWHLSLIEEDDEQHPYTVLTRWQMMISQDYDHELPVDHLTVVGAADYLNRHLHRIANDETQDFLLLKAELKDCRKHLESVLHNDEQRDRGAPCPTCRAADKIARLERQYAHWCTNEGCEKFHFTDDGSDVWVCPRDRSHWWTMQGYADVLAERHAKPA